MPWQVLHGKRGRVVFLEEPFSGSELGLLTLGESLLGLDEADADGLERFIEFIRAYNWRLLVSVDAADVSHLGTDWREFIPGLGSFTGRIEGFVSNEDEGEEILNKILAGERHHVEAHLYGALEHGYIQAGLMVTSRDHEIIVDNAERVGFEFVNFGYPKWIDISTLDRFSVGLIAYWNLDEGSGSVANDSAPYNNDGTLIGGPTWVTGRTNSGLQVSGGAHVSVPKAHPLAYRYFLSVSIWFKPNGAGPHGLIGDSSGTDGWRLIVEANGKVSWTIGNVTVTSVETINPSGWNHIVATYHPVAGRMRIYINNVEDMATGSRTGAVPQNTNPITIGKVGTTNANGIIDQVRIYGLELSQDPIQNGGIIAQLYQQGL
jgi:hypothetical protein